MSTQSIYILIALVVLAGIAITLRLKKGSLRQPALSPLAGLAFALVLGGIIFGENRWIGYSLIGAGVLLAIIDIFVKAKK